MLYTFIMSDLIYLPNKDVYLARDGSTYTDDQLDELMRMEREWKEKLDRDLPRNTMGWLKIFPEAIRPARRGLKEKLKRAKQEILDINRQQEEYYDKVISQAHFSEQAEIKEESDREFDEMRKAGERKIKGIMFGLSYLNEMEGKGEALTGNGVSEADIARAKEVPIEGVYTGHLSKHSKLAVGKCPFHQEKTGSFTIYLDQNSWWCYGCQEGGSVVDFVMKQNGVDFLTAVKQLLK